MLIFWVNNDLLRDSVPFIIPFFIEPLFALQIWGTYLAPQYLYRKQGLFGLNKVIFCANNLFIPLFR